jgi:hypothetical protein
MVLKCQCCGFEQEFASAEEAFEAGWDAPPYFSDVICCGWCPASYLVLGIDHSEVHERWKKDGRPTL